MVQVVSAAVPSLTAPTVDEHMAVSPTVTEICQMGLNLTVSQTRLRSARLPHADEVPDCGITKMNFANEGGGIIKRGCHEGFFLYEYSIIYYTASLIKFSLYLKTI